jgi:glycerophosphoryl diester phosphodiesterase
MQNPWIRKDKPIVIAHRGNTVAAPENTLAAYELARQAGAEMIETDVNITRDGRLVIVHDWFFKRTTDLEGMVHSFTLDEVRKADAGSWFNKDFSGERVPTIEEALQFAKRSGMGMCFEVKGGQPKRAIQIAELMLEAFKAADAFEWAFMSSYYHEALAAAKALAPQLLLAPERIPDDVEPDIPEALRQAISLGAQVLQIHYRYLYPEVLKSLRDAGIAMWAWPTTTRDEIIPAIRTGADAIMGDDPALAVELVKELCQAT